jgi:PD-(D/E)XK endonuclease
MTQNDRISIENESLFLRSLAVISLRIPWDLRYDLAYYLEETTELVRIQCKAGRYEPDKGCIVFKNFNRSGGRGKRRSYVGDAEYFGVYCAELHTVYLVPINIVPYAGEVHLRIQPTKNHQEKKVIWAKDYEI